ncbi:hypothetical protein [Flavobacterium ginsenosidimutans]|uniref:Uncharacterized protein n=1 Tax=Flavobacterium ginsenosidimutans TaxID=687844 RepID=A0ABZ2QFS7_9FLAO|nr:hypothetical protein [Flavobacterium ginsenosidimutans]KAF2332385.1 hypothetical protein DM444_10515 [Flavobacterium ginsenosidimutans]
METNKDSILRNIKYLSDFLSALSKQKPLDVEDIDNYINEFTEYHFRLSLKLILEKETEKIIEIISGNVDYENIKDFADLLHLRISVEMNKNDKKEMSGKIIQLYEIYNKMSKTYSFENQLKMNELKKYGK